MDLVARPDMVLFTRPDMSIFTKFDIALFTGPDMNLFTRHVFPSLLPGRFLYDVHVECWVWLFGQRLEVRVSLIAGVITEYSLE